MLEQRTAAIGHNSDGALDDLQRLADQIAEQNLNLVERADELAAGAARVAITDAETAGKAALMVKLLITAAKTAADRQREVTAPYQDNLDAARNFFKPIIERIATAKHAVLAKLDAWSTAQEQIAREARRAAQAEAEAALVVAATSDDLDAAFDAKQRAEQAAIMATVQAPEIRSAWGHLASSRETWGFSVTDLALVPRQFLMLNEAMVKAHIKVRQKDQPPAPLAGITFTLNTKTVVR